MRITCFITVCVYLSSTVFADEIKPLNRIKKPMLRRGSALRDFTVKREIDPIPEVFSDVYYKFQKPRAKIRFESFQKPLKVKFEPQQHRHENYSRSRRLIRRLKTRSIAGTPYGLDDNQLNELTKPVAEALRNDGPIHIEPVLRVKTKHNVFDSMVDIVKQLLYPPKNEKGPLVGPIQIPGSGRKIYLRLLEPLDASHVMVRFVTQVKVPVAEQEPKQSSVIPVPPIIDPGSVLLKNQDTVISDVAFASSRHVYRNATYPPGKTRGPGSLPVLNSLRIPSKDFPGIGTSNKENFLPGKEKDNKPPFVELNLENQNPFLSESPNPYYPYQVGEDAVNQVKQLLNDTTLGNGDSKDPPGTWYTLNTHRLPLRQIAPLYPLASIDNNEPNSFSPSSPYGNTYQVREPSDVLTGPSMQTSSYAQFNVDPSPASTPNSFEQHDDASNSYSITYKPNDAYTTPSSYQKPSEFNGGASSYSIPYQSQNGFNDGMGSYSPSYGKQNDLYSASSSYSMSYDKPSTVPASPTPSVSTSYQNQNTGQVSSSSDALRVIDPPPYFPGPYQEAPDNYANRSLIRQLRYNMLDLNVADSRQRDDRQVIWGETKEKNSKSSLETRHQNGGFSGSNESHANWWQSRENTDWHEADLAKVISNLHETKQSFDSTRMRSRNVTSRSMNKGGVANGLHDSSRRRGAPAGRASKCSVFGKEGRCEQERPTLIILPEGDQVKIEKEPPTTVEMKPIAVIASNTASSDTVKSTRLLDATMENPTSSPMVISSSTVRSLPLIIMTESPTVNNTLQMSLPLIRTTKSPQVSSTTESLAADEKRKKPTANDDMVVRLATKPTVKTTVVKTTMRPTTKTTTKPTIRTTVKLTTTEKPSVPKGMKDAPASLNTLRKLLPKRPMVMKKPTFIMQRMESSSTTKRTVTSSATEIPTVSSTTKKATTRKSTFRGGISRKKSSTT